MGGGGALALDHAAAVMVADYMAVKPDETVVITADTETDRDLVDAVLSRVHAAGARGAVVTLPQVPFQGALADPFVSPAVAAAVANCQVWLDFTFPYLAGSHPHDVAVKEHGVRYLLGGDLGRDGAVRLFGGVDLDLYFEASTRFDELIAENLGKEVRITDTSGTDVSFRLGKPGLTKPRRAEAGGLYVVPGTCAFFPELETVRGEIVLCAVFHEHYTPLREPLRLSVDGRIRAVSGGTADRVALDRALRRAGGGDYGYVIHFTHGLNPAARFTGRSFIEDARVLGNNAVGFGLPWWVPGGGENHPDGVVSRQSIWVDGTQIVRDGLIVAPGPLAAAAERVVPLFR